MFSNLNVPTPITSYRKPLLCLIKMCHFISRQSVVFIFARRSPVIYLLRLYVSCCLFSIVVVVFSSSRHQNKYTHIYLFSVTVAAF